MRLRDDTFLNAEAAAPQPRTALPRMALEALRGIGDPMRRETDDFIRSFGEAEGAVPVTFKVGDNVEFHTPDGIRRTGALHKQQGEDWVVKIDEGVYNIVPNDHLTATATKPQAEKRDTIRDLIATADEWTERSQPEYSSDTDFRIVIDYGVSNKVPSDEALCNYVERRHAARVQDAEVMRPGVLAVFCSKAELVSPSDPTSTDQPGLETEEMEGTGKIGYVVESLKRIAALNPNYDFVTGTIEEDILTVTASFTLQNSTGDKLYLSTTGAVTPVISENVVPAVGQLSYDGTNLTGGLHAAHGEVALGAYGLNVQAGVEPPYSQGGGPLGTRDDEPGSFETGSYVVKAEDHVAAPPAEQAYTRDQFEDEKSRYEMRDQKAEEDKQRRKDQPQEPPQEWMTAAGGEEDGAVREEIAGPGEVTAVDLAAEDYWKKYYDDGYGEALTRDPRRLGQSNMVRAAWVMEQDRQPTEAEIIRTLVVLNSTRTAFAAMKKEAKESLVPMKEYVNGLMSEAQSNSTLKDQLDKMVTGFISKNPGVLEKIDPVIYPRLLYGMSQDSKYSSKLQRLYRVNVDQNENRDFGTAEDFATKDDAPAAPPEPEKTPGGGQEVDLGGEPAKTHPELSEDLQEGLSEPASPVQDPATPKGPGLMQRGLEKAKGLGQKLRQVKMPTLNPGKRKVERGLQNVERQNIPETGTSGGPTTMGTPNLPPERGPTAAREANRQPAKGDLAAMCPVVQRHSGTGGYLHLTLTWDTDSTEAMSAGNIKHQVISFVKGLESKKEYMDYGTLGKVRFVKFDADVGFAEIKVRSSEARSAPQEFVELVGEEYNDASS